MENTPLEGKTKIIFGLPPANQRIGTSALLALVGTAMFLYLNGAMTSVSDYIFITNSIVFYVLFLGSRKSIELDFDRQIYFIHGRSQEESKSSGGRLTDIRGVFVTRAVGSDSFSILTYLEFHPEANQEPYRIDNLFCSLSGKETRDKMRPYLDLAARLNVPLRDDSGWNGDHPPIRSREVVIKPGEVHPALLRPPPAPKKWNKW